jgi:hypothetical protein
MELHLKNKIKYLGVILDEKLNWNSHIDHRMRKVDRKNMGTETKGCVMDIHFGGKTNIDLRSLTVVEKSVKNKFQSKNSSPATPCLYKHNKEHAYYSYCSSGGHTDVAKS